MRTEKRGEDAKEATPGLQVFAPGETIPSQRAPATPRRFQPGRHPLDDNRPPLRRQVGRRIIQGGPGEDRSY
jgi:hypothetical protein